MCLVDANIVLRYILNDHSELSIRATEILENHEAILLTEVICEVVYVLQKVYHVPREEIRTSLCDLIDEHLIKVEKQDIIKQALLFYSTKNIDIVDAVLWAYHAVENRAVFTFDDKLNKYLIQSG
ncbi:MAG: PIN domain-containing protein [Desulfobacterales bacterium]|nr:PIN domain-containing protein [Desulfobacterales bacterium]